MRGLARVIERTLTPAPFVGGGTVNASVMPYDGITSVVPPDYYGRSAARVVSPDVPAELGLTGFLANEGTTTGISAAWRCLHILCDGIAGLGIYAFDDSAEDARVDSPRVLAEPWPVMTAVEWRSMLVSSLLLHGNAYLLPFDADPRTGYPRQLPIVHPDRMHVELKNGRVAYFLDENRVSELDVLHIRGYTPPGQVKGLGVVESQRRGIQLAVDIDRYQLGQLEASSVPPVVIRVNRPEISETQALDIQAKWVARHGFNRRAPAVIPTSMEVQPVAWSPEDAQFLESKQFMAVEVCWWFGIDPRLLGLAAGGQSLTYSNIETTYVDLQRMSYMPWTTRIEAALTRVLPRNIFARFDFSPILRTTLQDRYAAYAIGVQHGWLTPEEVRVLENMGPLGSDPEDAVGTHQAGTIQKMRDQVNESLPMRKEEVVV